MAYNKNASLLQFHLKDDDTTVKNPPLDYLTVDILLFFHDYMLPGQDDGAKGEDFRAFFPSWAKTGSGSLPEFSPIQRFRRVLLVYRLLAIHYFTLPLSAFVPQCCVMHYVIIHL
jgi:hypothetical protein